MVILDATRTTRRHNVRSKLTVAAIFGVALLMLGLGCQQSSDAAAVSSGGEASVAENTEVEALRNLAFQYWEAFNDYDVDRVLAFLEPAYRAEREEQIREDIARVEQFSVELGVTEHLPPHRSETGEWQMFLLMDTPIDVRRLRMAYQQGGDRWWITYAEEVE